MSQPDSPQQSLQCLNCSALLEGPYCHRCGQKHKPHRESFWHIFVHFLGDFLHFDSKVFRTFRPLIFKPGQLARDYVDGRRVRYLDPIRMYVFLSIVFFFLFFWTTKQDKELAPEKTTKTQSSGSPSAPAKTDSLSLPVWEPTDSTSADSAAAPYAAVPDTALTMAMRDSLIADTSALRQGAQTVAEYRREQDSLPAEERDGFILRQFKEKGLKLKEASERNDKQILKSMGDNFLKNLPKLFFLLLPVIALILKLLYIRRKIYYTDHFFFSVFFYCFVFTVYSLTIPLDHWLGLDLGFWMFWASAIYLLVAMKRFYGQSWRRTTVKMFLLAGMFSVALILAVIINATVSLLMIE